jgi:hemin uptake protein HemP
MEPGQMSDIHVITPEQPQAEHAVAPGRRIIARSKKHPQAPASLEPPPQYESEALLAGGEEALIIHRNETYRLRRTWTGKLILTK